MRLMAYILALVLIHSQVHAGYLINPYIFGTTSSPSYLIDEEFSGTTTPSGWTDTNADHSTAGVVIFDYNEKTDSPSFTAQTTVYIALAVNFGAVNNSSGTRFLRINNSSGDVICNLQLGATDILVLTHGTSTGQTSAISAATDYYLWMSYTSAGAYTLRVGTTGTYSSASLEINNTNGTSTDSVASIQLGQLFNDTGGNITMSRLIVSSTAVGDI